LRFKILFIAALFYQSLLFSQIGGRQAFRFVTVPFQAQVASSGGNAVSLNQSSAFLTNNPGIFNSKFHQEVNFSFVDYIGDIKGGMASYARTFKNTEQFYAGMYYMNYGNFQRTNVLGEQTGDFTASDFMGIIAYTRQIDSLFSVGGSFKNIYAAYDNIYSYAILIDVGAYYLSKDKKTSAGITLNNIGRQIKAFYEKEYVKMPFNISLGLSQKLGKAPLRFTFTMDNLQQWNLVYDDGTLTPEQIRKNKENLFTVEKFLRHLTVAMAFLPSDNFFVEFSYNYRKRKELKYDIVSTGFAGIGVGAGISVSKFKLSYARNVYNTSGAANVISVSTNITKFTASKTVK
jgi:hypothetical protein